MGGGNHGVGEERAATGEDRGSEGRAATPASPYV